MADFNMTFQTSENMSASFGVTSVVETGNYNNLGNKPQINDIEVVGNKTGADYNLQEKMEALTVQEVQAILYMRGVDNNG